MTGEPDQSVKDRLDEWQRDLGELLEAEMAREQALRDQLAAAVENVRRLQRAVGAVIGTSNGKPKPSRPSPRRRSRPLPDRNTGSVPGDEVLDRVEAFVIAAGPVSVRTIYEALEIGKDTAGRAVSALRSMDRIRQHSVVNNARLYAGFSTPDSRGD